MSMATSLRFEGTAVMLRVLSAFLLVMVTAAATFAQSKRGDVVFRDDFSTLTSHWQGIDASKLTVADGRLQLRLAERGDYMISAALPVEKLRGMRLTIGADVTADNVSRPKELWNGIKLMIIAETPGGTMYE